MLMLIYKYTAKKLIVSSWFIMNINKIIAEVLPIKWYNTIIKTGHKGALVFLFLAIVTACAALRDWSYLNNHFNGWQGCG